MQKSRPLVGGQGPHQPALSILKPPDKPHPPRPRAAETEILLEWAAESGSLPADVIGRTQPLVDETIATRAPPLLRRPRATASPHAPCWCRASIAALPAPPRSRSASPPHPCRCPPTRTRSCDRLSARYPHS